MSAIAMGIFVLIAGWIWFKKPNFPAKMLLNTESITYISHRRKWLAVYLFCLIILVVAGAYIPFIEWLLST